MSPQTRTRDLRNDDGLTLVEMVVAIGVLMVVLIASLGVFVTVQKAQQTAEGTDRAIQLANGRIERIRQLDFNKIGFAQPTYSYGTSNSVQTEDRTTYLDYNTRALSKAGAGDGGANNEASVFLLNPDLTYAAETNTGTNIIKPYETTTETKNKFTVYTTITWGRDTALGLPVTTGRYSASNPYSYKRVRVTVVWRSNGNGAEHTTTSETTFAPQGYDLAPPGIAVTNETTT